MEQTKYHMIPRTPSEDELKNIFASSCIESIARRLGCPTSTIYKRMKKVNLINGYIYPFYDTLHTESRENVTDNILQCLKNWENE